MNDRTKPPSRRSGVNQEFEVLRKDRDPAIYNARVNLVNGRAVELFLTGPKTGTDIQFMLDDASIIISIALQHGISAHELARTVSRLPPSVTHPSELDPHDDPAPRPPASVIGAALDIILKLEEEDAINDPRSVIITD